MELLQSETDKVVRASPSPAQPLARPAQQGPCSVAWARGSGPGSPNPAGVASPTLARCPPPAGMAELVRSVRSAQAPTRPPVPAWKRIRSGDVLNTIHEIVSDSLDNARSLLQARRVPALVALGASGGCRRGRRRRSRACWGGAWVGGASWAGLGRAGGWAGPVGGAYGSEVGGARWAGVGGPGRN